MHVPNEARSAVLEWAHSSSLACHPGVCRTLALLNRRFWWTSVRRDMEEFVVACPVCTRAKTNSQRPQGLLQPLPVPHRPWSHIAIDIDLLESQGHSAILTIVDCFSKSAHFIPLTQLPSSDSGTTSLPSPWTSSRGHFRQGASIHQCLLEGLLHSGQSKTSTVIRIPSTDQRPNGETQSRT